MLSGLSSESRTVQLAHYLKEHPSQRHYVEAPADRVRMTMKAALHLITPPVEAVLGNGNKLIPCVSKEGLQVFVGQKKSHGS